MEETPRTRALKIPLRQRLPFMGGVGGPGREARLLAWIKRFAIKPAEAGRIVAGYRKKVRAAPAPGPDDDLGSETARVADLIIRRFAARTAVVGGGTAIGGVFPGAGTLISAIGGSTADALTCTKLQVDMCLCLAGAFGHDMASEETFHLACLLAAGGVLEKAGIPGALERPAGVGATDSAPLASPEGVQMVRQHLKGVAVQAVKEMFKRLATTFSRRAVAKATPLGIGVLVGGGANFALTRYVGRQAKQWFVIDSARHAPAGQLGSLAD